MAISNGFCLIYWGSRWWNRWWHRWWKWRRWALPWFLCISSSMASTLPSSELTTPALLADCGSGAWWSNSPARTVTLLEHHSCDSGIDVRHRLCQRPDEHESPRRRLYAGASAWRCERPPSCSAIKLNQPIACSLSTDGDEMGRTWATTRERCEIALLTGIVKGRECGRLRLEKIETQSAPMGCVLDFGYRWKIRRWRKNGDVAQSPARADGGRFR